MSTTSQIFLCLGLLVLGFALGVFLIIWLINRKSKEFHDKVDLIDRKQIKRVFEVTGNKLTEEQLNRFIASIKENEKKKLRKSKGGVKEE